MADALTSVRAIRAADKVTYTDHFGGDSEGPVSTAMHSLQAVDPHEDNYTEQVAFCALRAMQGVRVWPLITSDMLMRVHSVQVSRSAVVELPFDCRGEGRWAPS